MTYTFGDARLPENFWRRVARSDNGCWEWTAAKLASGYGSFRWKGAARVTHKIAYTELVGGFATGLQLDHLCRNRACCNPSHLEPVTARENLRRGQGFSGINAAKTHCPSGHEYTPENTYSRPSAPTYRECRTCRVVNRRNHYIRERAA